MCLKYKVGSLKTQSMMQSTICLPRFSNSLPLKRNVHNTIKRSFMGCNVGLKVRERGGQMILGFEVHLSINPKVYADCNSPGKFFNFFGKAF